MHSPHRVIALLDNPGFYMTYAVVQAVVVLLAIRFLDLYEREPLALLALMALWGATGAAAIALVGNRAVRELLGHDARIVFGDAVSAPFVEEIAKGLALLAVFGPGRWLGRRLGVVVFEGVTDGIVYGAAVGIGFAFTEDFFFFVDRARGGGLQSGLDVFLTRRDFFGPAVLHHAVFTAAFGAGLGLATWTRNRVARVALPLAGLAVAILVHGVNDGLVQFVLVLRYGLHETATWAAGMAPGTPIDASAASLTTLMRILDYWYVIFFLVAIAIWLVYQRQIISTELAEEVDAGLLGEDECDTMLRYWRRSRRYWRLLRSGQLEQWRHIRRVHHELAHLALLKWRIRRFGGDWGRVQRARRELATLSTYEVRPTNLPAPATPLVGRERELGEARRLLLDRDVRVLTFTGPGGAGKTRLALAVAADAADSFASGVFFVALASVVEPDHVLSEIASTLGVREVAGEPLRETLADELRDKQLLLVLDNLEQVLAAGPPIADLLAAAARVRVLATSRERLRIRGEKEYPVEPLAVPAADAAADELPKIGAVALFVARVKAAEPSFRLTDENAAAIAAICRRLDGLPLALELAAARAKVLSPEEILARLERPFAVLEAGAHDLPERQRTLRAAIDWSYELLPRTEQRLFARLAVFPGGVTLDAAEHVCANGADGAATVEGLASLVDKSLLRRERDPSGPSRFRMLETIREYGREKLASDGDAETVLRRHAEFFLYVAETAEADLLGGDQAASVALLTREHENLRAALQWALQADEVELAIRTATALGRFWELRGTLAEARSWLERALASTRAPEPKLHASALYWVGRLALLAADYDDGVASLRAALQLFRASHDDRGTSETLWELGWIALIGGEYRDAQQLFEDSLALARSAGDTRSVGRALTSLGRLLAERGEHDRARTLLEEGLELRRDLGDRRDVANSVSALGRAALLAGDHGEATRQLDTSASLARELDDKLRLAEALYFRALVALAEGETTEAEELLEERFALSRSLGDKLGIAECLDAYAATTGDARRAARLLGAAERLRKSVGAEPWPFERTRNAARGAAARAELGDAAFEQATAEGRALTRDEAAAYALARDAALAIA